MVSEVKNSAPSVLPPKNCTEDDFEAQGAKDIWKNLEGDTLCIGNKDQVSLSGTDNDQSRQHLSIWLMKCESAFGASCETDTAKIEDFMSTLLVRVESIQKHIHFD